MKCILPKSGQSPCPKAPRQKANVMVYKDHRIKEP
jgi:hypothetical protein